MIGTRLKAVRGFVTKHAVKQFADKFHLVYFGHVNPRDDDYELVRGVTVSTTHIDNHYTVGTVEGHDLIFVERGDKLYIYASKTRPTLAVMQDMVRLGLWLAGQLEAVIIS